MDSHLQTVFSHDSSSTSGGIMLIYLIFACFLHSLSCAYFFCLSSESQSGDIIKTSLSVKVQKQHEVWRCRNWITLATSEILKHLNNHRIHDPQRTKWSSDLFCTTMRFTLLFCFFKLWRIIVRIYCRNFDPVDIKFHLFLVHVQLKHRQQLQLHFVLSNQQMLAC